MNDLAIQKDFANEVLRSCTKIHVHLRPSVVKEVLRMPRLARFSSKNGPK